MEKITYKLEVFEGPLDLLLHLISDNKLNICDIPVAVLIDQYMEHIRMMQEAEVEVAVEFMRMASRLLYIKTAMLLPKHEEVEELKKELVGELIEYQMARQMAGKLAEQANFDQFSREETELPVDHTYRLNHDVSVLYEAYISAAGKRRAKEPPSKERFEEIVARPVVSVTSKVYFVLRKLYVKQKMPLEELFGAAESRSDAVATFLAVLELLKAKRVQLEDDSTLTFLNGGERNWRSKKSAEQ